MRRSLGVSERRACRTLGQHRSTQRQVPRGRPDEDLFTEESIELAKDHGRYEYRMITGLLNNAGWHVNPKRVERIWRREGLKVPSKQPGKGRLWLNDGSCVRPRPEQPIHVWSYDFVQDRTHDGRVFRRLIIIDEFTREALMIRDDRKLNSVDVVDALTDLFILRGPPAFVRSDNGPEFVAEKVTTWISAVGAKMAFIKSGSPSENGYCESFNTRFRNELLKRELFWHPVGSAVQLLLLTGQRRDEVSHMRWTDLDLDAGIRTIPAERNKSGRLHVVLLSPLFVTILQLLPRSDGFVSWGRTHGTAINGWSRAKVRVDELSGVRNWRLHELRRTAATVMARLGFDPHVVERVLNHAETNTGPLARVYQRHAYEEEKRAAQNAWSVEVSNMCAAVASETQAS